MVTSIKEPGHPIFSGAVQIFLRLQIISNNFNLIKILKKGNLFFMKKREKNLRLDSISEIENNSSSEKTNCSIILFFIYP